MSTLHAHERLGSCTIIHPVEEVLYYGNTKYQELTIVKVPALGVTIFSDGFQQSDEKFNHEYHNIMTSFPAAAGVSSAPRVLVIGMGTESMLAGIWRRWPEAEVVGVEIDVEAYDIYRKVLPNWGPVKRKPYNLIFADAYRLNYTEYPPFDAIFFDIDVATSPGKNSHPADLLRSLKSIIRHKGVFVSQAGPLFECQEDYSNECYTKNLTDVFPTGQFHDWPRYHWRFFYNVMN